MLAIKQQFTEFYYQYKIVIISVLVGILIGVGGTSFIVIKMRPDIPDTKPSAKVENKSGAPLKVKDIKVNKDNTYIDTSYDGIGESTITIPTAANPSAYAWENYRMSAVGGYMSNKTFLAGMGYRYDKLTVMGGAFVKIGNSPEAGLWAMASWSFKPWWE